MKEILLHIGMHKTGSTSIQASLKDYSDDITFAGFRCTEQADPLGRGRSVRQPEHALRDDVQLDLGGAAFDRIAARSQPVSRLRQLVLLVSRALPAERLGTRLISRLLVSKSVLLGP